MLIGTPRRELPQHFGCHLDPSPPLTLPGIREHPQRPLSVSAPRREGKALVRPAASARRGAVHRRFSEERATCSARRFPSRMHRNLQFFADFAHFDQC